MLASSNTRRSTITSIDRDALKQRFPLGYAGWRGARAVLGEAELWLRRVVPAERSAKRLAGDAQRYWANPRRRGDRQNAHWRGAGIFADDATWRDMGCTPRALFDMAARAVCFERPLRRVLEWGCGGGAIALHFAQGVEAYYGVDVSEPTLAECARQMQAEGLPGFVPVLVGVDTPEDALGRVPRDCDLFIAIQVFEVLPTPEHGYRILRVARELLAPGGMALVQVRYVTTNWRTAPRRWRYRGNLGNNTAYHIHEFWTHAQRIGLQPEFVTLSPTELLGTNYAYFVLTRPR